MTLIQLVLIVGCLGFLYRTLTHPSHHQLKAWSKIIATAFVIAAILTISFPNSSNVVAHWLGVARGADLLLYLLTLAFVYTLLNAYVQEKRQQRHIVLLARKIALLETDMSHKTIRKS
jgi:hypothetical protein